MKREALHMENLPLFILCLGFLSTLGGAVWFFLCRTRLQTLYPFTYRNILTESLTQMALSAALHLLLSFAVWLDMRKRARTS